MDSLEKDAVASRRAPTISIPVPTKARYCIFAKETRAPTESLLTRELYAITSLTRLGRATSWKTLTGFEYGKMRVEKHTRYLKYQ